MLLGVVNGGLMGVQVGRLAKTQTGQPRQDSFFSMNLEGVEEMKRVDGRRRLQPSCSG